MKLDSTRKGKRAGIMLDAHRDKASRIAWAKVPPFSRRAENPARQTANSRWRFSFMTVFIVPFP